MPEVSLRLANKGRRFPAEPLTDDEVRRLVAAVRGRGPIAVRNRALIVTLWGSGIRISEALALMPRDVQDDALRVRHGKGDRDRVVGLRPEAMPVLDAWLAYRERLGLNGRQPIFCTVADGADGRGVRVPGQPLDPSYARRLFPKLAKRAGISKRVHPHGLRHTHATGLVERGVALHVIAGQLGHASTATTDVYLARVAPAQRLAALRSAWSATADSSAALAVDQSRREVEMSSPGSVDQHELRAAELGQDATPASQVVATAVPGGMTRIFIVGTPTWREQGSPHPRTHTARGNPF